MDEIVNSPYDNLDGINEEINQNLNILNLQMCRDILHQFNGEMVCYKTANGQTKQVFTVALNKPADVDRVSVYRNRNPALQTSP